MPRATKWFAGQARAGWASCPITENGCARIMSHPAYPNALPVRAVMERLAEASASGFHEFWADDISLLDAHVANCARIHGPRQITDVYLLALAVHHGGQFVTLRHHGSARRRDRRRRAFTLPRAVMSRIGSRNQWPKPHSSPASPARTARISPSSCSARVTSSTASSAGRRSSTPTASITCTRSRTSAIVTSSCITATSPIRRASSM